MWSKIKKYFRRWPIPISVKLTMLYAGILLCILLVTSVLTLAGMLHTLHVQAKADIDKSRNNVIAYINEGNPVDQKILQQNLLLSGVALMVYDAKGNLLFDSDPNYPGQRTAHWEFMHNNEKNNPKETFLKEKDDVQPEEPEGSIYYEQTIWSRNQSYILQFRRDTQVQTVFMHLLAGSLTVTNLFGLFIAIISGLFISRKVLRPIREITSMAQTIEINNLDQRIDTGMSDDELGKLATTINHMLDRIETGVRQQKQFAANASHELRTPVTVISGYADLLDRWGKNDENALEESIAAIKSEASNMQNLIDKLLFLARADQSKQIIHKEALQMEQVIEEVYRETLLIAPGHQVTLIKNEAAVVEADASLLKEMLRIFIENSIKFTPAGGFIKIASQLEGTTSLVSVQDSGIGIPGEEQTKIFERFYRVDKSRTKATGGTGLGLSIAKWIAELHHSEISIFSTPGEGTTVQVRIPLK